MRWCAHLSFHNFHTPHQRVCASNAFSDHISICGGREWKEPETNQNKRTSHKQSIRTKEKNCFFFLVHILIFWLFCLGTYSKFQLPWYPNQTPHKCTTSHKNKNKTIACQAWVLHQSSPILADVHKTFFCSKTNQFEKEVSEEGHDQKYSIVIATNDGSTSTTFTYLLAYYSGGLISFQNIGRVQHHLLALIVSHQQPFYSKGSNFQYFKNAK